MGQKNEGNLLIIGGAEDKKEDCVILKKFIDLAGKNEANIAVLTSATTQPESVGAEYHDLFLNLGAKNVEIINVADRLTANSREMSDRLRNTSGLFFTGGDQLRITSILGGTILDETIHEMYRAGVIIAGTSAGASMMSTNMIVEGDSDDTAKKCTLKMAPGLGLLQEIVIDQHFAQRGRIGRLFSAIAQNPYILGIGIDEDTAILVNNKQEFTVIGSQTVTVVDGRNIVHSNVSELKPHEPLAISNVIVHVLPSSYQFDLNDRKPIP